MMKKLLLMMLLVVGGVMSASADDFLLGDWSNWGSATDWNPYKFDYSNGTGTLTLNLTAGTHKFKFVNGSTWIGNDGTMYFNKCTDWVFDKNADCTLVAANAGDYTFTVTWVDHGNNTYKPHISVIYPEFDDAVYFCNTLGWAQPYAFILTSAYWDNSNGSGSKLQPNGIAMTNISGNVWKAEFPSGARSSFIAFNENPQNDYDNFYNTGAVYRTDFPAEGKVYVPSTTGSETLNGTTYYNTGEWHAYPAYTRNVTSGNFGTICVPFDATVEGATVYEISSKVMDGSALKGLNLTSVSSLEAGKAYIFKATGSTLTATYSGSYADAIDANGMMGNLSDTKVTVSEGNYVVGNDNKIHKVISGGNGVTVGQYRAYITLNNIGTSASRSSVFMDFGDISTGIESLQNDNAKNVMYNLNGQRVKDTSKGMFVVNGKKVIKK